MKWHEPREAEIECVLSRGDRRVGRILHTAWKSGVRFDGWTEHFRYDLWMKAFEAEGIPKESYLRDYDLDEVLPWDVLDVSIKKRWLQIELIKAKKEMRTEDCKWGHCYACGVPGNGEDTVLARGDGRRAADVRRRGGAGERSRGLPRRRQGRGLPPEGDAGPCRPPRAAAARADRVFRHRVTFSKTGDARFLSHRNTMDVLERAIRAAGLPARYSEGFNPHMKLSMGPALALGLESRHEVFDVEGIAPVRAGRRRARSTRSCPPGIAVLEVRELARGRAGARQGRQGSALHRAARLRGARRPRERRPSPTAGAERCRRCARSPSRPTAPGASLVFEVNLDQSAGDTATAKKVLEALLVDSAGGAGLDVRRPRGHASCADDLPRHRHGPLRGRAQPDRLRGRTGAAPRPLLPGRGGARGGTSSSSTTSRSTSFPAKKALEAIAKELDYSYINEHPDFRGRNTSAENLARYFSEKLEASGALGGPGRGSHVWEAQPGTGEPRSRTAPEATGFPALEAGRSRETLWLSRSRCFVSAHRPARRKLLPEQPEHSRADGGLPSEDLPLP